MLCYIYGIYIYYIIYMCYIRYIIYTVYYIYGIYVYTQDYNVVIPVIPLVMRYFVGFQ